MSIKVLLADDELAILKTMTGILESEGLQVVGCTSASDALKCLAEHDFDLVITDMRMEVPDAGCQVVRAAAGRPIRPVIVVLTGFPISPNELRTMGAATVLLKGTSPRLLLEGVHNIINAIETHTTVVAP